MSTQYHKQEDLQLHTHQPNTSNSNSGRNQSDLQYSATEYHAHSEDMGGGALVRPRRIRPHAAVGNFLYELGFATEYLLVKFSRGLRNAFTMLVQVVAWLAALFFGWLKTFFRDIWRDFFEPFRKLRQQRIQLERLRERAQEFGYSKSDVPGLARVRVKTSLRILSALLSLLLPVAAAAALVLTVSNVATMQYALAVEIDGQRIGYVADQSVVETAKSLLLDRLSLADNQEKSDWQLNPTYTIARVSSYTTTPQLVNEILRLGSKTPGDIMSATGLYLNNHLFAVTDDGVKLKQYLDKYLQEQQQLLEIAGQQLEENETVTVSYVNGLACDPESEEVFFSSSVLSWDEMLKILNSNVSEAEFTVADGEKSLAELAVENGISQEILLQRNPTYLKEGIGFVPDAGTSIKLQNALPLMQVQEIHRRKNVEEIPFRTVEEPNPERAFGTRWPVQEGAPGVQEVWDDFIYIDGEERGRVRVDTNVLQPPVDKIVQVGTNQLTAVGLDEFMFPVPSSVWSSRGISSYHRGLDINAKTGDPVFACQAGTVVTAGWHYSYGNYVVIDHPNGITTLYAHNSQLYVEAGQQVMQGDLIAAIGSTGNSSGPHCHLEFQKNGALLNPLDYIKPPPGYRLGRG